MELGIYRSSKTFKNFPCAHRRWRHDGHCAFVHGYSRSFTFWFACNTRTENGFVMDFGDLKEVHKYLEKEFDHTLLLDDDDPLLPEFRELEKKGACKVRTWHGGVGMEGTAEMVYKQVNFMVTQKTAFRVWVTSVECRENEKNSAVYYPEYYQGRFDEQDAT